MRGKFFCSIGLLASVAAGAGPAVAADMPVRPAPSVAALPAVVPDWVGFYVGIHGGGGWGHTSFEPTLFDSNQSIGSLVPPDASPKGGVFGFQVGHNWQWGPVVGGLEIDFSGANINESTTFSIPLDNTRVFTGAVKIDELLSARGRLGYLILPNLLAYGTAGIGLGHERFTTTMLDPNPKEPDFESRTSSATTVGWVAGAGLEWKFWDHWLLRGEWLHYDFGRATHIGLMPDGGQFSDALEVRTTVDVARAALSYKF